MGRVWKFHRNVKGFLLWISFVGWGFGMAASSLQAQPDQLLLDHTKDFGKKSRAPVSFSHNRHVDVTGSCKDCHHIYEQEKNVLDEGQLEQGGAAVRCSSCHPSKSRLSLERAFHDQCMGCHRKVRAEKKKGGPRYCGECHRRP